MKRMPAVVSSILATLVCAGLVAHAGEGISVVVLEVQLADQEAGPEMRAAMAQRLAAILGKTGRFQVIPPDQFGAALTEKACQDLSCQLKVAQELGAQAAVQTEVEPDGRGCTVTLTLLDVASTTPLASGAVKNKCSPKFTMTAMDGAVVLLTHEVNSGGVQPGQAKTIEVNPDSVEEMKQAAEAEVEQATEVEIEHRHDEVNEDEGEDAPAEGAPAEEEIPDEAKPWVQ